MNVKVQPVKFIIDGVEQEINILRLAHIGFYQQGFSTHGMNFLSSGFGGVAVAKVIHHNIRAQGGKMLGDGRANTPTRAGDEGNFIAEQIHGLAEPPGA